MIEEHFAAELHTRRAQHQWIPPEVRSPARWMTLPGEGVLSPAEWLRRYGADYEEIDLSLSD